MVNQSLAASRARDRLLLQRAAAEAPLIERVRSELAARVAVLPMLAEAPVGPDQLRALARGNSEIAAEHPQEVTTG